MIDTSTSRARTNGFTSTGRRIAAFCFVVVVGFLTFALPAIFLQTGHGGGYQGRNLALLGIIQLALVTAVLAAGLHILRKDFRDIGLRSDAWPRDVGLGVLAATLWALVQFGWLFPATGGAGREDIAGILSMVDGDWHNVLWYLPLGVLGGGVAEELYNRGFFITVLEEILGRGRTATGIAALLAIVFFAAGHLPGGWVDWMDILVPSAAYTGLFLYTRRLTAPIVAHAVWNVIAVAGITLVYG